MIMQMSIYNAIIRISNSELSLWILRFSFWILWESLG